MLRKIDFIWLIGITIISVIGSLFISTISPIMVLLLPIAWLIAYILCEVKWASLSLVILVLPFFNSIILTNEILPIPGMKISNLLLILIMVGFLLTSNIQLKDKKLGVLFFCGHVLIFIIAILRADYIGAYTMEFWKEQYSPLRFFLSHGLIPILTCFPFFMIISLPKTRQVIYRVNRLIALSTTLFSLVILLVYIILVPQNIGNDYYGVRIAIGEYLGMNGNNLADFFIATFPFLLSVALIDKNRKKISTWLTLGVSLAAIAILYSRTAYFLIIISMIMVIVGTRKYKYFIHAFSILAIIVLLFPSTVTRSLTGFDTKEVNDISAGRTGDIWEPITENLTLKTALVGNGIYGIFDTQPFKNMQIIRATHAHNMYLDTILNTGLVGLIFYISFIGVILYKLIRKYLHYRRVRAQEEIHILTGLIISIVCFLIRGLSDSFLLPQLSNSYFYIILALSYLYITFLEDSVDITEEVSPVITYTDEYEVNFDAVQIS